MDEITKKLWIKYSDVKDQEYRMVDFRFRDALKEYKQILSSQLEPLVGLPSRKWNNNADIKPVAKGHYLTILKDGRCEVMLWKEDKWWYDETQQEGLLFGMKDDYIIKWMAKP